MWILAVVLFLAAAVLIALRVVRAARESMERKQASARGESRHGAKDYSWLGDIHGYWWALGSAAAALKFIYRQWKTAPVGSWERLGWGALLALIVAVGMYAALRLLDYRLNRSEQTLPDYREITNENGGK